MCCKNKVAHGIPKRKSKFFQFALRPFPCSDDFRTGFLKILPVPDCLHTKYKRCLIERVGIERIFHIIDIPDQLFISHRKAKPHTCQGTRF